MCYLERCLNPYALRGTVGDLSDYYFGVAKLKLKRMTSVGKIGYMNGKIGG